MVSKKTRFDIFKRDGFTCQYCGRNPPTVILECDHIEPRKSGGTDDPDNLITSCFDCNRGKAATPLDIAPESIARKAEVLAEKEEQAREYTKLLKKKEARLAAETGMVVARFEEKFSDSTGLDLRSVKKFICDVGVGAVLDAMDAALIRNYPPPRTCRYFYGACWGKIKDAA